MGRTREDVAQARAAWHGELAAIDPACLIFIDETGIDTRLTRAYGRAARGQRAIGKVPHGNWQRLTVIGALALDGVVAAMSIAARDQHRRVPGLYRAGANAGPARPARRPLS